MQSSTCCFEVSVFADRTLSITLCYLLTLRNMPGTASKPTKDALLSEQLNPLSEKGASGSITDSVSGSASEAVLLRRLAGMEIKSEVTSNVVADLSGKMDMILNLLASKEFPQQEPPVTAASSGGPVVDPKGFVTGSELPRHPPRRQAERQKCLPHQQEHCRATACY